MRSVYDYAEIHDEFVTSTVSLVELAKKHDVSRTALWSFAKNHGWEEEREKYARKKLEAEMEKNSVVEEKAWTDVKSIMRKTIDAEWKKLEKAEKRRASNLAHLTKATAEARKIGAYGVTTNEKRLLMEIKLLEKQLADANASKDLTIIIGGSGGEYAD